MRFSKDFMVGSATAAHQVEGNNDNCDIWVLEQMPHSQFREPSLDAVDHYHHYREDIRMLAEAGLFSYRFSVEWSRIEPQEGRFDPAAIEHYRDVIRCCKAFDIRPVVTMHHFTSPVWLIRKGGWEAESTVRDFSRYCEYVVRELGDDLEYVCTINEANTGWLVAAVGRKFRKLQAEGKMEDAAKSGINMKAYEAYMKTVKEYNAALCEAFDVPDASLVQDFLSMRSEEGDRIVMRAHEAARDAMKAVCPHLKIGATFALHDVQAAEGGEANAAQEWKDQFTHYLPYIQDDDFVGVQVYTRKVFGPKGVLPVPESAEKTQMGYEFYPQGLSHVIRKVAQDYHGDILVTENGVATDDDTRRVVFIQEALDGVYSCIADGLPVIGYFYWSLLDNFEWKHGYGMTFGLIGVDRSTQVRYPKPSLMALGEIGRESRIKK